MKLNLFFAYTVSSFIFAFTHAHTDQTSEKSTELPRSEMFLPPNGKLAPLQGKIINNRYYAPKNVFSCQADNFGESQYIAQDGLWNAAACVGFYNGKACFKKAEVIFMRDLEKTYADKSDLQDVFKHMGIGILEAVDNAQGIEILKEEMVGNNMLFVAISIEKMSVLRTPDGQYMSSTRGYLIFQEKDKLVLLSNQEPTLLGQEHTPKKHIEKLKNSILEFRKTFEFGSTPALATEKIDIDVTQPLRITQLIPRKASFAALPIEPAIPKDFIALSKRGEIDYAKGVYWGPKRIKSLF